MFDNIAPAYDRLNHTLSLSVDRIWRRRVVRIVGRLHPRRVLDMATGTGDLAVMMARSIPEAHIKGVDLSEGMLDVARRKVAARGLEERVTLEAGVYDALSLELGAAAGQNWWCVVYPPLCFSGAATGGNVQYGSRLWEIIQGFFAE